jgi:hypothetical protein
MGGESIVLDMLLKPTMPYFPQYGNGQVNKSDYTQLICQIDGYLL